MIPTHAGKFAVVAHDAGAGNHIISWLRSEALDISQACFCFEGPALKVAEKLLPAFENRKLDAVLCEVDWVLSGTGWASSLEHMARMEARQRRLPVVAVIDHWTQYRERFVRDGFTVLPDEIWVVDEYALKLAQQLIPGVPVKLQVNDYLRFQMEEVTALGQTSSAVKRVLFLMEPIRQKWNESPAPGEIQAFDFMVKNLPRFHRGGPVRITVKPHPSDATGKYESLVDRYRELDIVIDEEASLAKLLAEADIVAGCHTYAMVVAAALGREVYSCLPPSAPRCVLPQKEINSLSDLVENNEIL